MMWIAQFLACGAAVVPESPPADPCAAGALPSGELILKLTLEHPRQALVWFPSGPGPHDVVVNFHEFRSEPRRQAHYSRWIEEAERRNAILIAPDGKSATWNAGGCCGKAAEEAVDDLAFLDALLERVDRVGCTSGRVLATGIGNGGMMAHRWACERDAVDAVVSVGGALQTGVCSNARPVPWLHLHGEADALYPLAGGPGHRPVQEAISAWQFRNQATEAAPPQVDGVVSCESWSGAAPIVSCRVAGMTDLWPGAAGARPGQELATTHPLADATRGAADWVWAAWGPR